MPGPSDKRRSIDDILGSSAARINELWDSTTAASDDFEPIPPGTYRAVITGGGLTESTTGKPSYKLELTIIEGPHANRRLWHDCWLTAQALSLAKRDLHKVGITRPEDLRRPPRTGIVVDVRVGVRARDDGTNVNRVVMFKVASSTSQADPLAEDVHTDTTDADGFDWRTGQQTTPSDKPTGGGA